MWQVISRFVLNDPSSFTDELARYLLIWVGLLGASYASGQHLHLAIDLLPTLLKGRRRALLLLIIEILVFLFALGIMVIGGVRLVSLQLLLGQTSAALQLPLGVIYLVLPVSGALIMFYTSLRAWDHLGELRQDPPSAPAS
ncbi:MAG: TRAP transporter small permease [Bacteroidota bacterium]